MMRTAGLLRPMRKGGVSGGSWANAMAAQSPEGRKEATTS
jgi:hypothetical protein